MDPPRLRRLEDGARFRVLSAALEARLLPEDASRRSLRRAVRWISETHGAIAVGELARRLQWSPRRLERHFASAVGLSPKSLCRIHRFQQVLLELSTASEPGGGPGRPSGLADLALRSGCADQAHLACD